MVKEFHEKTPTFSLQNCSVDLFSQSRKIREGESGSFLWPTSIRNVVSEIWSVKRRWDSSLRCSRHKNICFQGKGKKSKSPHWFRQKEAPCWQLWHAWMPVGSLCHRWLYFPGPDRTQKCSVAPLLEQLPSSIHQDGYEHIPSHSGLNTFLRWSIQSQTTPLPWS